MANNVQQHKVTRSYLSQWVGDNGKQVFLYDLLEGKLRPANPYDTFTERYFNDSDVIKADPLLSEIENRIIPTLKEVVATRKISGSQKAELCTLVASQRLRTDFARKVVKKVTEDYMKSKVGDLIESPTQFEEAVNKMLAAGSIRKEQASYMLENKESFLDTNEAVHIENDKDLFLSNLIILTDELAQIYASWEWTLFIAPKDSSFITTDNPVGATSLYDRDTQKPVMNEVHFPLSPGVCIRMVRHITTSPSSVRHTIPVLHLNKKQTRDVNVRLICEAGRYIIAESKRHITHLVNSYRQNYLEYKAEREVSYGDPSRTPASNRTFRHIFIEPARA